tara:strand:- start:19855 stop:20625 length:771 start_codon:yes stop_codon:yes gene_type:complete
MSKQYETPLIELTLGEWVEEMEAGPFAQVGYSDAEWFCILRKKEDRATTGLGQKMTYAQGNILFDIIKRRHNDPKFCFAMPEALWNGEVPVLEGDKVGQYLKSKGITGLRIYERDIFTDHAARDAKLWPLIQYLRKTPSVIIGPHRLRDLVCIGDRVHVPIVTPNLHLKPGEVENAAQAAVETLQRDGRRICLVSAGVSAAVLIDRMWELWPRCVYFDCGSIWDAFVGMGEQRQWRADLYSTPITHRAWVNINCGQ